PAPGARARHRPPGARQDRRTGPDAEGPAQGPGRAHLPAARQRARAGVYPDRTAAEGPAGHVPCAHRRLRRAPRGRRPVPGGPRAVQGGRGLLRPGRAVRRPVHHLDGDRGRRHHDARRPRVGQARRGGRRARAGGRHVMTTEPGAAGRRPPGGSRQDGRGAMEISEAPDQGHHAAPSEAAGRGAPEPAPPGPAGRAGTGDRPGTGAPGDGAADRPPELDVRAALEAILMVVDEPVPEADLAKAVDLPADRVRDILAELAAEYTAVGRGFDLREVAGGWRIYTRPEYAPVVERFVRDGQQARLTQAALETLAVVAYRQPVSRARVSAVRGVNSDGVMRTLVARGLIEEAGTDPESQAVLYRTTNYFLEKLGLRSLDELPELAPFLPDDVENIEETST